MNSDTPEALGEGELAGLTVLVTRPRGQAEATCAQIQAAGGQALCAPCLREEPPRDPGPLRAALAELPRFAWVALTSQSGAHALLAELRALGMDPARALPRVAAVGPRTAAVLAEAGVTVALQAAEQERTGAGLAAALVAAPQAGPILLPRAEEGRDELVDGLRAAGVAVTAVAAYRMAAAPPTALAPACAALRRGEVDLVPLASPRTAAVLLDALGADAAAVLNQVLVGAIGSTSATALRAAGVRVSAVAQGSFTGLLRALAAQARPGAQERG